MKSIDVKEISKNMNQGIDKVGKGLGMNYFERRKFKKTVNNFAYDTGVQVVSTLIVEAVEGAAYLAGRGVVLAANGVVAVGKAGVHAVTNTAKAAGKAVSNASEKIASKKAEKAEEASEKEAVQEFEEAVEELVGEFEEELNADAEAAEGVGEN